MAADYLTQTAVFLGAAVVVVPICAKLGLGSVLGYLLAGVMVGPSVLNLAGETQEIMRVAEFGVVVMLFLVGLGVQPKMLWRLKGPVFGLGGLQVVLSIPCRRRRLHVFWACPGKGGLPLALPSPCHRPPSSYKVWPNAGSSKARAGRPVFPFCCSQDIAVIPMLAVLPMLALAHTSALETDVEGFAALAGWLQALISLGVIIGIIVASRLILRPVFRAIAATKIRELFVAVALFVVVGISALMGMIQLSAALGAFIGGMVLADSEYRHEIESDLEPFKGLLLGLFFITVGANIDLRSSQPTPADPGTRPGDDGG